MGRYFDIWNCDIIDEINRNLSSNGTFICHVAVPGEDYLMHTRDTQEFDTSYFVTFALQFKATGLSFSGGRRDFEAHGDTLIHYLVPRLDIVVSGYFCNHFDVILPAMDILTPYRIQQCTSIEAILKAVHC